MQLPSLAPFTKCAFTQLLWSLFSSSGVSRVFFRRFLEAALRCSLASADAPPHAPLLSLAHHAKPQPRPPSLTRPLASLPRREPPSINRSPRPRGPPGRRASVDAEVVLRALGARPARTSPSGKGLVALEAGRARRGLSHGDRRGAQHLGRRGGVTVAADAVAAAALARLQLRCDAGQQYLVPTSAGETLPGSTRLARAPASPGGGGRRGCG